MINRMQCTGILINDGDKAFDFYANKLGFKVTRDQQLPGGGRFFMVVPQGGGAQLMVCTPVPGVTDGKVGGQTPIAWETDDIHGTYEELRAKGVDFPQPPTQQFWGGFEAVFQDPDGNIFKLLQNKV